MKGYRITLPTHAVFQQRTRPGYTLEGPLRKLADGYMEIQVEDDTAARLERLRLPNESDDDLIFRVLMTAGRKAN